MKRNRIKNIPEGMRNRRQWVAFRITTEGGGELKKMPINPHNGSGASHSDPEDWGTLGEAMKALRKYGCQAIGFALTEDDPYFLVDLDKCVDRNTGKTEPQAMQIVNDFKTLTERSISGTGLHLFGEGSVPPGGNKKADEKVEIYDHSRFAVITGNLMPGTPTEPMPRQRELDELHAKVFGEKMEPPPPHDQQPQTTCGLDLSEEEIIHRAAGAKNGAKFQALWEGNWKGLYGSHSEADLALCRMLGYWTNGDPAKVERLFRKSGLMRDKWDRKGDSYSRRTIEKALAGRFNPAPPGPEGKELIECFVKKAKEDPKAAIREALANESVMNAMAELSKQDRGFYESILLEVQGSGATVREVESVKKAVNASARKGKNLRLVQPGEKKEQTRAKDVFPDAPVGDDLVIPPGWQVNEDGVHKEKKVGSQSKGYEVILVQVTFSPILQQKKLVDGSDGTEGYCLLWLSEGEWKTLPIGRGDMADSRLILKWAEYGLPVTTPTANLVVEYLAAFEAANSGRMPKGKLSSHMGWQGRKGSGGFLWGENYISTDGTLYKGEAIKKSQPHELPPEVVFLKPKDPGTHQLVSGFRSRGSAARWLKAMEKTEDYPLLGFAVFSSLAAPLLTLFGIPNLIVDYAYTTSTGKTTALKAAASCWGNPNEREGGSLLRSWDATRVFMERDASLLCNLPVILDETKRAKRPDMVAQAVYDFAGGQGRGRGNIEGTRKTESWRTILLSSGESKVTSFSADAGGAHARALSLWGAPFGKQKMKKAALINEFTKMIEANYGHAGPRLVAHVFKNRDSWPMWKAQVRALAKRYRELAGDNGPAQRQAESFAIIHFAGQFLDQMMGSPWELEETMASVHKIAARELSDSDRAKDALGMVFSWANAHSNRFLGRAEQAPHAGYLGVWPDRDNWRRIAFHPPELDEFLSKRGFEPKSILKTWRDRKWLATEGKGLTKKVAVAGERPRCYVVRRRAFDEVTE